MASKPYAPGWWDDLITRQQPSDVTVGHGNYLNVKRLGTAIRGNNAWLAHHLGTNELGSDTRMSDQRVKANLRLHRTTLNQMKQSIENSTGAKEMNRTKELGPSGVPTLRDFVKNIMDMNPDHPLHHVNTQQFFSDDLAMPDSPEMMN